MSEPLLFFLAVATVLLTPGPTNTLMATSGATAGVARSLRLLPAELLGYVTAITAIRIVLEPVLVAYPAVGIGLKVAVAVYLLWLAFKLWRRPIVAENAGGPVSFRAVLITTLLNPKALIFAVTIFPQSNDGLGWYLAGFSGTVIAAGFGWIVLGAGLGAAAGQRAGLLPRVASVALLGFAGLIVRSAF